MNVLVEGDFEVEELVPFGIHHLVDVELRAVERIIELGDVVEQETGARGMGFNNQGTVLELVEVLLDVLVACLGLELDGGDRPRHGNAPAFPLFAGHQPFDVLGPGGLDAFAGAGLEQDARVTKGDGAVAVIRDDEPDGHDAVAEVIDAEQGFLLLGVVRFGGDGDFFIVVDLDGSKRGGWLDGWSGMFRGDGGQRHPKDQKR